MSYSQQAKESYDLDSFADNQRPAATGVGGSPGDSWCDPACDVGADWSHPVPPDSWCQYDGEGPNPWIIYFPNLEDWLLWYTGVILSAALALRSSSQKEDKWPQKEGESGAVALVNALPLSAGCATTATAPAPHVFQQHPLRCQHTRTARRLSPLSHDQ